MPSLEKDDVAIIDNMRSHHAKIVTELLNKTAISCLYLLPYSPDLNPIEMMWSKMKSVLQKIGCRTAALLPQVVIKALALVSASDCMGWFAADGYRPDFGETAIAALDVIPLFPG